jgi:hypothetical protein
MCRHLAAVHRSKTGSLNYFFYFSVKAEQVSTHPQDFNCLLPVVPLPDFKMSSNRDAPAVIVLLFFSVL